MANSKLRHLTFKRLVIPFKIGFNHAQAQRHSTESLWVHATSVDGVHGYGEACPRHYVTGETLTGAVEFLRTHAASVQREVHNVDTLRDWLHTHRAEIDRNPAASCALELALLEVFAKAQQQSVEALLNLPALHGTFRYSAVIGDCDAQTFATLLQRYLHLGMYDFKIKLSGDLRRDHDKRAILEAHRHETLRVRADANNLWRNADDAIGYLHRLDYSFWAIEEPVRPGHFAALTRVGSALEIPVILDESVTRIEQLAALRDAPHRWIVNLRLSKMGGLLRSLNFAAQAREYGIPLIVGAHVGESSLLTRTALSVVNAQRASVLAQEGAFGTHLLAHDVCAAPLMFGNDGVLDAPPPAAGWGLAINIDSSQQPDLAY